MGENSFLIGSSGSSFGKFQTKLNNRILLCFVKVVFIWPFNHSNIISTCHCTHTVAGAAIRRANFFYLGHDPSRHKNTVCSKESTSISMCVAIWIMVMWNFSKIRDRKGISMKTLNQYEEDGFQHYGLYPRGDRRGVRGKVPIGFASNEIWVSIWSVQV